LQHKCSEQSGLNSGLWCGFHREQNKFTTTGNNTSICDKRAVAVVNMRPI
jgi:hypothetical protein